MFKISRNLPDEQVIQRAVNYFRFLKEETKEIDPSNIILMEETAVCRYVTAVMAVNATGNRITPLVITKGKDQSITETNGCWFRFQPKAWINSALLKEWIEKVFQMIFINQKKALVWDSLSAHISKEIKEFCKKRNIRLVVIPGGMTAYLQAEDIGIYKSFKDKMSALIDNWKNSDKVQYTKSGNPKQTDNSIVAEWCREAWKSVPNDVFMNSILSAGFAENAEAWFIANLDVYGAIEIT